MYDLLRNTLESTIQQWRGLRRAFLRLADSLKQDKDAREAAARILADRCDDPANPANATTGAGQLNVFLQGLDQIDPLKKGPDQLKKAFKGTDDALQVNFKDEWHARVKTAFDPDFPKTPDESAQITSVREEIDDLGVFIRRRQEDLLGVSSLIGERANIQRIRGSVEDLGSFPILTSDVDVTAPTRPVGGATGGSGLESRISSALREVLGRVPRLGDPRSFKAALTQSFELREVEGHTVATWTPHSYIGQTELGGGVTGAQASLYSRASVALDHALPLLDGLYALKAEADRDEVDAIRAIVRSELIEVVAELKTEGGPRVARVDGLFDLLLGATTNSSDVHGHLGQLEKEFGFEDKEINTLDEELDTSNFIAVVEYAISMRQSWDQFKGSGGGASVAKDLGTRLVLLSRTLSVAAESVQEVYAAMDSVFVGPSERQVASFQDRDDNTVLVEELLSWITTFASDEAPRLVHEGGRLGAEAIIPTAIKLEDLVDDLIEAIPHDPGIPSGMKHSRVRRPLEELASYLNEVRRRAEDIGLPLRETA